MLGVINCGVASERTLSGVGGQVASPSAELLSSTAKLGTGGIAGAYSNFGERPEGDTGRERLSGLLR